MRKRTSARDVPPDEMQTRAQWGIGLDDGTDTVLDDGSVVAARVALDANRPSRHMRERAEELAEWLRENGAEAVTVSLDSSPARPAALVVEWGGAAVAVSTAA